MNIDSKSPLLKVATNGKITALATFNTVFNVMLGTGPILVPPVFQQPGIVLAFMFIVIVTLVSYICAEFVIETMSLLQAIKNRKEANEQDEKKIFLKQGISQDSGFSENSIIATHQSEFEYKETLEYGQIALELFGKKGQGFVTMVLVIYLVGVLSSKTIMIGSILSKAFSGVDFLDQRKVWIISFFTISFLFSFKSVKNTKVLQNIIILVRFFTIASLLIGSFQVAFMKGFHSLDELNTYFTFDDFGSFFSDLQFALIMHHAIPSMFANIDRQQDVKKVMIASFTIGSLSLVLLSLVGVMAFGDCLNSEKISSCHSPYTNGSSYFNDYFKGIANADWVFYIASFYIFLNVAAFPVLIITARNNLMKFAIPDKVSPTVDKWTILFNIIITGPIITIAMLTTNIQLVLDWISGIFGSLIISLFPSLYIWIVRNRAAKMGIDYTQNFHKAIVSYKYLPFITFGTGSVLLVYSLYNNFKKYT